jgi:hypothetical protein
LEAATEQLARLIAEREGCLLVKLQHGVVGMPDRLLVRPWAVDVFMEFKRRGEKPTKIQAYWHDRLRKMGKHVVIVRSAAGFREWLTGATNPV